MGSIIPDFTFAKIGKIMCHLVGQTDLNFKEN